MNFLRNLSVVIVLTVLAAVPFMKLSSTALADGGGGGSGVSVNLASCATGVCGLPTVVGNALVQGAISTAMTATTSTSLIGAVASQHIYVTSASCGNTNATATAVQIRDGSAGTILATLLPGVSYGGDNRQGSQPLFWTSAGNALYAQDVTTGASVTCNAAGYSNAN